MNSLAVLLTNQIAASDPIALAVALHQQGIEATPKTLDDGSIAFDLGNGAELAVVHIAAPHPDAHHMPRGPTSPSADEIASARAHIVVGVLHLDRLAGSDPEKIDHLMLRSTNAVAQASGAVAAMLGHGVYFHAVQAFRGLTVLHSELGRLPYPIVINVTSGQDAKGRLTLLSHGLARYGRMDLLVGCTSDMDASTSFIWHMIEWLMMDKLHRLVPGTLVPADDGTEQVARAVPNPLADGSTVVYIELGG